MVTNLDDFEKCREIHKGEAQYFISAERDKWNLQIQIQAATNKYLFISKILLLYMFNNSSFDFAFHKIAKFPGFPPQNTLAILP